MSDIADVIHQVNSMVDISTDEPFSTGIYMWMFKNGAVKVGKYEGRGHLVDRLKHAQDSVESGAWMVWVLGVNKTKVRLHSSGAPKTWASHVEFKIKDLLSCYPTQVGSSEIFECGPGGAAWILATVQSVIEKFDEAVSPKLPSRMFGRAKGIFMDIEDAGTELSFAEVDDGDSDYESSDEDDEDDS